MSILKKQPDAHASGLKPLRKPQWLKVKLGSAREFASTESIIQQHCLHTICSAGLCPNRAECWSRGTATFMIGGNICTRNCRFCNTATGRPLPPDAEEPRRVAESVALMGLRHAVITSVDRDDLPDLGAAHWAATVRMVRHTCPGTSVEVLLPDFQGREDCLNTVLYTNPDIVGHNMETTRRLTPMVRSGATYDRSLKVLQYIASQGFRTKTGFMLGLGEREDEILQTFEDIRATGCSLLTIGQYLQPSPRHLPVVEYVDPERFRKYRTFALDRGFSHVESGPLVRSSYHAEDAVGTK